MAQHDYVIANGTGAAVRSDLNNALAAIVSQNSGATEPTTTYAYQWWADTTTGLLKLRNAANNAWITLRELDGTLTVEDGTAAAPGLAFTSDLNTGIFRAGADQFNIATNGIERVEFGTSEVVFNDGGANYDFRIEGDTNADLFFVDASAEAVGIGTASPNAALHVSATDGTIYQQATRGTGTTWRLQTSGANGQAYELYDITNSQRAYLYTGGTGGSWQFSTEGAERARIDNSGRLLVGTSSASGYSLFQVEGNIQHKGAIYSYASKSWSTAAAAALFDVKMSTGHCGAILNWMMTDTANPNGVRTGTLTIAVRGSGTTKSAVAITQVDGAAVTSGTLSTLTWSAAISSNEVRLTATPSTDSGTATVYLWGSSPFFTSDGITAL